MTAVYFLSAVVFLTLGHVCKAIRWRRFVNIYETAPLSALLSALAAGYLVSFYVPLHLGELVRIWLSGRKLKNGYGYAIATIVVDRFLDVMCVGLIFLVLALATGARAILRTALGYLILTGVLLVGLLLVSLRSRSFKRLALTCCSVFNERIKFRLLLFLWSLISSFKNLFRKINGWKLLLDTIVMWLMYGVSYFLLAQMLSGQGVAVGFIDVFRGMFDTGALLQSTFAATVGAYPLVPELLLCAYILLPLPVLLLTSLLLRRRAKQPENVRRLLPHLQPEEQMQFLNAYFEGEKPEAMHEFMSMNDDVCILRDCSCNSDATTMLCMTADGTVYRKYAFGASPVTKLSQQVAWLHAEQGRLPLPEICSEKRGRYSYRYDMRCDNAAVGFFEYIHSQPVDKSWSILRRVLETLRANLYEEDAERVTRNQIDQYVDSKVTKNLQTIMSVRSLRALCEAETLSINGVTYRGLPQLQKMLAPEHLWQIFRDDPVCVVHGDLTIENIVCRPEHDDFYLIDPNPDNPVKTPAVDYAKLLQSLHGGYEYLRYVRGVEVDGNAIRFLLPDTGRYRAILECFDRWMSENLTPQAHRSVYYHEIIHWLRLLPYRLRKSEKGALQYFAAAMLIMNDIYDRFEEGTL